MFVAEAANLPTAAAEARTFFSVRVRTEREAREALVAQFQHQGAFPGAAHNYANETEGVWTDFPEVGITARIITV